MTACVRACACAQDILPYVPMLMPELQKALVDPLPEVRAMAARAMGSLMQVRGHGAECRARGWGLGRGVRHGCARTVQHTCVGMRP